MKTRRLLTSEFKAKVALEALRSERTIAEPSDEAQTPPEPDYSMEAAGHRQLAKVLDDKASDAQVSREAEVTKRQDRSAFRRARFSTSPTDWFCDNKTPNAFDVDRLSSSVKSVTAK